MGKDYCDKYVVVMETKADAKKLGKSNKNINNYLIMME